MEDLVEALCVIRKEGFDYSFVHRSFQEYFTALFLVAYHGENFSDLTKRIAKNSSDNTLLMAFELDTVKMEKFWLKVYVRELERAVRKCQKNTDEPHPAVILFSGAVFRSDDLVTGFLASPDQDYQILENISKSYLGNEFRISLTDHIVALSRFFVKDVYSKYEHARVEIERLAGDGGVSVYTFTSSDRVWMSDLGLDTLGPQILKLTAKCKSKMKESESELALMTI